jgi:hypothetical protein
MPLLKLQRRLPQKFALTARRGRTGLEQMYSEAGSVSPLSLSGSQRSSLTGMAVAPTPTPAPAPTVAPDLGPRGETGEAAEGPGVPQSAEDIIGQIIGNDLANLFGTKGLSAAAKGGIFAALKGVPLSAYPKGLSTVALRGLFAPATIAKGANIALGGHLATGPALEKGATMTDLTNNPVLGELAAVNAFQSDPHHSSAIGRGLDALSDAAFGEDPGYSEDPGFQVSLGLSQKGATGRDDPTTNPAAIQNALTQAINQQGYNLDATGIAALQGSTGMHSDSPVGGGASLGGSGNVGPGAGPGSPTGMGSPGDVGAGGGDGGTCLCTVLNAKGIMPDDMYKADSEYGKSLPQDVIDGYHIWAIPLAGWEK